TAATSPGGDPAADADRLHSPEELVALYNESRPPECAEVQVISEVRRKAYGCSLKQFPQRSWWQQVFAELWEAPHLRGLAPSNSHPHFRADLDWLCSLGQDKRENCVKTFEGKYHRDRRA